MKIKHLYIHVPFCKSICSYCDFCHKTYNKELVSKWLSRLKKEFKECNNEQYETIYIGGGTPSCLDEIELEKLLRLIKPHSLKVKEYTIEVNPESLSLNKIILIKKYGINRVSIGVESSNVKLLKLMNRHHTFDDVRNLVNSLKVNKIDNISVDIMYSLPTQTMIDLKQTIKDVLSLDIPHISLYSLTIEDNSVFAKKGYKSLDEEIEADMYEYIVKTLNAAGYIQYEIANFSKNGYESKHNLGYWRYEDFRGLSCGSSSKINNIRYDKTRDINYYINNDNVISNIYNLSKEDMMFENIMMSLRTIEGLNIKKFILKYKIDPLVKYKKSISLNEQNLIVNENYLRVKNRAIINRILLDFMD